MCTYINVYIIQVVKYTFHVFNSRFYIIISNIHVQFSECTFKVTDRKLDLCWKSAASFFSERFIFNRIQINSRFSVVLLFRFERRVIKLFLSKSYNLYHYYVQLLLSINVNFYSRYLAYISVIILIKTTPYTLITTGHFPPQTNPTFASVGSCSSQHSCHSDRILMFPHL